MDQRNPFTWHSTLRTLSLIVLLMLSTGYQAWLPAMQARLAALQQPSTLTNLAALDDGQFDSFGSAVAASGNTVVVGANGTATGGAAYVYVRNSNAWQLQQKLTPSDATARDAFGVTVACFANLIVVGAPAKTIDGKTLQGAVYIFERDGVTWRQTQRLTAADGRADELFGASVAVNLETVAIGTAPLANQRAVYVFVRNGANWARQQKLASANASISLSGDTLAVGAEREAVNGVTGQGAAYVYTRANNVWTLQQRLTAADGRSDDRFGTSVSLSGATLAVGAPRADVNNVNESGAAYVFTRLNNVWTQQQKLTACTPRDSELFGHAVAINLNGLLIGAPDGNSFARSDRPGAAYLFTRSGATWSEQQKFSKNTSSDGFGYAVSLSVNTVLADLDQINLELPKTLAGRGLLDLVLTVDGQVANTVQVKFK